MPARKPQPQWAMTVVILHSAQFGHEIKVLTQKQGQDPVSHDGGSWKGLGIPEPVLNSVRSMVDVYLTEHLVTRYGVAGELPLRWAGEPEPF